MTTTTVNLARNKAQAADAPRVLSFAQHRLWLLNQFEQNNSATYSMPMALQLSGHLNIKALQHSLYWLLERHTSLRSFFPEHEGQARVQIHAMNNVNVLQLEDLRQLTGQQQSTEVQKRADHHAATPFDLAHGPLFKADLLQLDGQQSVLLLNMHHIISDGWSMGIFIRDLQQAYTAYARNQSPNSPPLAIQYSDYAAWQRNWLQGEVLQQQLDYWQQQLTGIPELLELPTDNARPPQQSHQGAHHAHTLPATLYQAINRLSQQQGVTLFMTLLTVFNILLARYSRQDDICVGSPVSNRTHIQTEDLIGFFVNILVLRTRIPAPEHPGRFIDLLQTTRKTCLAAYAHQDIPFEMLVEQLQPARSLSHSPLFQVMLALQGDATEQLELPGLTVTSLQQACPIAKYDLTLSIAKKEGQLHCAWEYATDVFNAETIGRMAGHFETLLQAIADDPEQSISKLSMLTKEEIRQLQRWNDTATDYPRNETITGLFEQQVEQTPDNIALVFEKQQLSYRELNDKANRLAHYLLGKTGTDMQTRLTRNPLVAIAVERSLDMVIGLLGILKAGGAYVPIDPGYPAGRIRYLLDDCAAPVLLTQSHLQARLPLDELAHDCVTICLDEVDLAGQSCENPVIKRQAGDLAYVIYTSGSTGEPKGVMIEHKNLINLSTWHNKTFSVQSTDKAALLANSAFDASVWELWPYMLAGACVIPGNLDTLLENNIWHWLNENNISLCFLPTPVIDNSAAIAFPDTTQLRLLLTGGDRLHQCPDTLPCPLFNNYGPTENTVVTSSAQVCPNAAPTIGKPVDNVKVYILDACHQPQPPGIPGELCIAGSGLARGYLNRPVLTAEKFIEVTLFGKNERIYKTGDLARWLADGNLEYLGRIDHQINLRGFRIEPGEIEAALTRHPAVKEAVVTLYEADDNKRLVAYIIEDRETAGDTLIAELQAWLKNRLPAYMIPASFTRLESLPLTPNGKIDRQALAAPESRCTEVYEAPRNDIEQKITRIWCALLKQNNISIHDNFFELGGDSILSIQIVARARQAGLQLTPRDLFEHQSIAGLASVAGFGTETDAEQGLVSGAALLTPIQHWFFAQDFPEYWHFNQSILLQPATELNTDALRQALATVLSHHDALRLRYAEEAGHWQQSFSDPIDTLPFVIEDLSQSEDPEAELYERTQQYQSSLNINAGPLTYLVVFKLYDSVRLFWCIHHLAVDGVSWRILQTDLHMAYMQILDNRLPGLPAKTSSFKAWSEHLHNYASSEALDSELSYWQNIPAISLPMDNPAGENRLEHQQAVSITLDQQQTEALLREVPTAYNTRINDILLTALALALSEWTEKAHCLIDLEGHGRVELFDDIDLSRTVGWFTTIHPIGLSLPASAHHGTDPGIALKAIKEQLRGIPKDGIGYGLLTQSGNKILPKGDILFNYLGQVDQGIEADLFHPANEATGSDVSLNGSRDHLIDINGAITQGQLSLNWSYSSDCYQTQTIQKLAQSYKTRLQQLITHCQNGKQGVTASDFPLAPVSQSTLDRLYSQYDGLQDLYPISPMQQGMLFHTRYEPETGAYFEQLQITLRNLEPEAFKAAWQHQLERHPILRSAFLTKHNPILQIVCTQVPLHWKEHDWRELSKEVQQEQLARLLQQQREQGFNFSQAPLMRFDLIRLDKQRYVFIQHHHHILMDGWCLPITFSEVRDSYLAFKQGQSPQLPGLRPYRDYIAWLQQQDSAAAQDYWQQRLAGFSAPTPLPILEYKTRQPDYRETSHALDAQNTQQLQQFKINQRITLSTLVQGAWGLLLSRYSREADICFGVTVSGRNAPLTGIEKMMGLFINTLPLRIDANPDLSVKAYLQKIQNQHQNDNRYAQSPLFEIQNASEVPNGTAMFDSLLVFENYPLGDTLEQPEDCYQVEDIHGIGYSNYPLTLAIIPGETLSFRISYDNNRISQDSIERLWGHLNILLKGIADNPEHSISKLPILTKEEIRQLQRWNDTVTDYPQDKTITDLFEQQVEKTPDNIAVVFEEQQLSYSELNDKANLLAHYLLGKTGADRQTRLTRNTLVAISVERSLDMVIGLLGILKTGGAYVPIDSSYPAERIRYMLDDCAAPVLLTQSHLKAQLLLDELEHDCVTICLDDVDLAGQSSENPVIKHQADDLAYVIYTSGSTGRPKGVCIEHRGIVRLVTETNYVELGPKEVFLQFAPISFDASTFELWGSLLNGAKLVVFPAGRSSLKELSNVIEEKGITTLWLTSALFSQMVDQHLHSLAGVRQLLAGGETLSAPHVQKMLKHLGDHRLINGYGPTENTTFTCCHVMTADSQIEQSVPIGRPISNTTVYILDAYMNSVPVGVFGELYIGGDGLARGYLNRPELTAGKFVENPFSETPGTRLYNTGDVVRYRADGTIEFIGRKDNQIKIRGFRIELGEVEAALHDLPEVSQAVVILREDKPGDKQMIAYVVGDRFTPDTLGTRLKERLPEYMIPAAFVTLRELPLTPNGKIDKSALPGPAREAMQPDKKIPPSNKLELHLVKLWESLLESEPIGVTDDFFALGGHSLLAARMFDEIQTLFGKKLPLDTLWFGGATIEHLAQVLNADESTVTWPTLIQIKEGGDRPPLFCVHTQGGNLFHYYDLAGRLAADQPVYGLQARGVYGREDFHHRIEDIAAHCIDTMRAIMPDGPYLITGFSSGGLVAFEMAQQLLQAGMPPALLALVDTYPPYIRQRGHYRRRLQEFLRLNNLRYLQERLYHAVIHTLHMDRFRNFSHTGEAHRWAQWSYRTKPYPGPVTLFLAEDSRLQTKDPSLGWARVASSLKIYTIPGSHGVMMKPPNVMKLTTIIESLLDSLIIDHNIRTDW